MNLATAYRFFDIPQPVSPSEIQVFQQFLALIILFPCTKPAPYTQAIRRIPTPIRITLFPPCPTPPFFLSKSNRYFIYFEIIDRQKESMKSYNLKLSQNGNIKLCPYLYKA